MFADAIRRHPLPTPPLGGRFPLALRSLAAAGAFLLWASRRGFFNTWPV